MSRFTNLLDKVKAHVTYASEIVSKPFETFAYPAALLSSSVGLVLGTVWCVAMAGKEAALMFTADGNDTLEEKVAKNNNFDSILTESEEKYYQMFVAMPTSVVGTYVNKACSYVASFVLDKDQQNAFEPPEEPCEKNTITALSTKQSTGKIFKFIPANKNPSVVLEEPHQEVTSNKPEDNERVHELELTNTTRRFVK